MFKIKKEMLEDFKQYLLENEKSASTVEKYLRDVRRFAAFAGERQIDKTLLIRYKVMLEEQYAASGANSMLAAVNAFLRFVGWNDLHVKHLRCQKKAYAPAEKELTKAEYLRLLQAAGNKGNRQLSLLIQTICGTGIRVSELQYITVGAVRRGEATVNCKGKVRTVFIVPALQKKLLRYANECGITSGSIFVTKGGKPLDRSNVWRAMKKLCANAHVSPAKVFPHNLRHLFARTFYGLEKDIAKLADILGHSSINTTRIYIMTTGAEHRKRMEQMRLII